MTIYLTLDEYQERYADTLARVARENAIHITVRREQTSYPMWQGKCTCGMGWKFWFFGATLGYGLEHIRREIANGTEQ